MNDINLEKNTILCLSTIAALFDDRSEALYGRAATTRRLRRVPI